MSQDLIRICFIFTLYWTSWIKNFLFCNFKFHFWEIFIKNFLFGKIVLKIFFLGKFYQKIHFWENFDLTLRPFFHGDCARVARIYGAIRTRDQHFSSCNAHFTSKTWVWAILCWWVYRYTCTAHLYTSAMDIAHPAPCFSLPFFHVIQTAFKPHLIGVWLPHLFRI